MNELLIGTLHTNISADNRDWEEKSLVYMKLYSDYYINFCTVQKQICKLLAAGKITHSWQQFFFMVTIFCSTFAAWQ